MFTDAVPKRTHGPDQTTASTILQANCLQERFERMRVLDSQYLPVCKIS
jgi:hypothetical protein